MMCYLGRWIKVQVHQFDALLFVFDHMPYGLPGLFEARFISIRVSSQKTLVLEVLDELSSGLSITV